MQTTHLILVVLLAVTGTLHARTSGGRPDASTGTLSFMLMDSIPSDIYYDMRGRAVEVKGHPWSRTQPMPVERGGELVLYRQGFGQDNDQRQILARTQLPSGTNRYLVLAGPAPEGSPYPWRLFVLDDSSTAHPHNSVRVLNLCPVPLAGDIAGHQTLIKPGATELVRLESAPPPDRIEYKMAVEDPEKGWVVAGFARTRTRPELRTLLIARPAPEGTGRNGVAIEMLRDR